MYASVIVTATGVLAIGSAWFFVRPFFARKTKQQQQSPSSRWQERSAKAKQVMKPQPTHRAVSVCPGAFSCQAIRELEETRYLSGDAPMLPLRECDQEKCKCVYEHHDDRRAEEDRRNTFAAYNGFDPIQDREERRERKERRGGQANYEDFLK